MSKKKSAAEPVEYIDSQAFDVAKEKIIGKIHNDKGIGTLSEKTLHADFFFDIVYLVSDICYH